MRHIHIDKQLPASAEAVRGLFWDIERWHRIWDPVQAVTVVYDDQRHQEFKMALTWRGTNTTIRTIRFRLDNGDIEFFSPNPPGDMARHHGSWEFFDLGEGKCRVLARRKFWLRQLPDETERDYHSREIEFASSFQGRIGRILDAFDRYLSQAA